MGTPTLTRPLKVGNVHTYVDECNSLAPADAPILAPEVDADLDTLYNAWNSPASTFPPAGPAGGDLAGSTYPNPVIAAGAVTDAKIANVAYAKVTGAPTALPPTGPAGGDLQGAYPNPTLKAGVVPSSLPPSGPAGGDLAGSTYPNPIIAAGAVTTAKLAPGATLAPNTYNLTQAAVMQSGTAEQVLVEITVPGVQANRPLLVFVWITGMTQCPGTIPTVGINLYFYLKLGGSGVSGTQLQSQRIGSVLRSPYEGDSWTAVLLHYYVGTGGSLRFAATGVTSDAGATATVLDARIMALPFA